jgi:hypothetical protein
MPTRTIEIEGRDWRIFPSGYVTQYEHDEFALIFVHGTGPDREIRVTRYSPLGVRSREASLGEMSDNDVRRLFDLSQRSETSPEAGYAA